MRKLSKLLLLVSYCFIIISCGYADQKDADDAARMAINEWALDRKYPYEIIRSEVSVSDLQGHAFYIALITDDDKELSNYPIFFHYDLKKIGDQWIAEREEAIPVFDVEILDNGDAYNCTDLDGRTPQSSPCLRITNLGVFDFEFKEVCTGVDLRTGGWASSCGHEVYLDRGKSFNLILYTITWEELGNGYFVVNDLGSGGNMMILSEPIP